MNPIIQPDIAAGIAGRDEGIANAEAGADLLAYADNLIATHRTATELPEFTTDDITSRATRTLKEPRALGGIMNRAERDGVCELVEATKNSEMPQCHRRPKRVWRSLIYQGTP